MRCSAVSSCAVVCTFSALRRSAACSACRSVRCGAVECIVVQYIALCGSAVQCNEVACSAVQYSVCDVRSTQWTHVLTR